VLFEESLRSPCGGLVHVLCISAPLVAQQRPAAIEPPRAPDAASDAASAATTRPDAAPSDDAPMWDPLTATGPRPGGTRNGDGDDDDTAAEFQPSLRTDLLGRAHTLKNHVAFLMAFAANDQALRKLNASVREFGDSLRGAMAVVTGTAAADARGSGGSALARARARAVSLIGMLPFAWATAAAQQQQQQQLQQQQQPGGHHPGCRSDHQGVGQDLGEPRPPSRTPEALQDLVDALNDAPMRLAHLRVHATELLLAMNPEMVCV
jgi:hypothetical protein